MTTRIRAQIGTERTQSDLDPELHKKVRQHDERLETLAATLKALGVDNGAINQHVTGIRDQYKGVMLQNLERIGLSLPPTTG